jgi:hypothetical protein
LYNNFVVEKINGMAYIVTLLMFRKQNKTTINVRYIIIETKEFARIAYNGFLFPHAYSGGGR